MCSSSDCLLMVQVACTSHRSLTSTIYYPVRCIIGIHMRTGLLHLSQILQQMWGAHASLLLKGPNSFNKKFRCQGNLPLVVMSLTDLSLMMHLVSKTNIGYWWVFSCCITESSISGLTISQMDWLFCILFHRCLLDSSPNAITFDWQYWCLFALRCCACCIPCNKTIKRTLERQKTVNKLLQPR